jgi:Raf kinase inhibitor-like YbhB/YbcL family protein
MALQVMSTAFADDQQIPAKYTCDGSNTSPPLKWTGVPAEAKALAVVVDDPDAPSGLFTHWLVYDLPARTTELPEGVPPTPTMDGEGRQGMNDFRAIGYGGPCPPSGSHRYVFTVYALDAPLGLAPGVATQDVRDALGAHIVAEGSLTGRYIRG